PARRLPVLRGASHVVLARDTGASTSDAGESHARAQRPGVGAPQDTERVVGFVTALSDGVLMAYLPLLEVLPAYQGRGIGTELVRRVLTAIGPLYGVDVCCDDDVLPFYRKLGFAKVNGMVLRRPTSQSKPEASKAEP
ncbi:MAG: GNAT family N-acetyltransferase, partial [Sciscionella sp.]|nr:GNAT family N-acetyltransferase [Sciscionella sp.]